MWREKLKKRLFFIPESDMVFETCRDFRLIKARGTRRSHLVVSVIIVNYNGRHLLEECLNALKRQTFQAFEVIVVDNGSRDDSVSFIQHHHSEVIIIALPANYGFAPATHMGIRHARGAFIFLLNNDATPEPSCLEMLVKVMETYPEIGSCATRMVLSSVPEALDSAGDGFSVCGAAFKRGHLQPAQKYHEDAWVFGACGGAALYRRKMLEDVGLLDERYFIVHEDSDLNFRAQMMNYSCRYVADAVVSHRCNATLSPYSSAYVYFSQRNVERLFFKNVPGKLIWKMLPRHILYNLFGFFYFLIRRKGLVFLQAKLDFVRGWKEVRKSRKKIQNTLRVDAEVLYKKFDPHWMRLHIFSKVWS